MPQPWGLFREVQRPSERQYLLAYWRFLLGWGKQPPRLRPHKVGVYLRQLAKDEVINYRLSAQAQGGARLYAIENNWEPPPPPPKTKAA
jgi:hypothetical protein